MLDGDFNAPVGLRRAIKIRNPQKIKIKNPTLLSIFSIKFDDYCSTIKRTISGWRWALRRVRTEVVVSGGGCCCGGRVRVLRRHVREWIAAQLAGTARMLLLHLLVRVARHAVRPAWSAGHVRWRTDPGGARQVMRLLEFQESVFGCHGGGCGGCGGR